MTYSETIDYLFSRLPMFQRVGAAALKPGLDNIISLCNHLGNPQHGFKSVHIAGTNGKGSTANMLSSILQEAGYKVGLFTSPHLIDFRERIRINGEMISADAVVDFVRVNKTEFEGIEASFFEYTTAMAFWYFEKEKVDLAIIETGLGGRLDSTNILQPLLSIITSISLDHTYLLGDTVEKIALEKAGIIKSKTPVILGQNKPAVVEVINAYARGMEAEVHHAADYDLKFEIAPALQGAYQQENIKTVLKASEQLNILGFNLPIMAIQDGLSRVQFNTGFAGRWQLLSEQPRIIADVAHNEDGLAWVVKQLENEKYERLHFVFGVVQDKTLHSILPLLPKDAVYYFCNADTPRALPAAMLMSEAEKFSLFGEKFSTVKLALKAAENQANNNDLIFIGGSVFVVAEAIA